MQKLDVPMTRYRIRQDVLNSILAPLEGVGFSRRDFDRAFSDLKKDGLIQKNSNMGAGTGTKYTLAKSKGGDL
ncbi:MAG: hypothetical protein HC883_03455 [Bdellovibrionaceae bacterium]|nr:hypothetical protein [Pseudobdellovibrionaceae bacterium]